MADFKSGINAATKFLSSYLAAEEKKKQQTQLENTRKKMEEAMNSGDYQIGINENGMISLKAFTPEDKIKAQKSQFELQELKRIIAKRDAGEPLTEAEEFQLTGYRKPAPNMWGAMGDMGFGQGQPQTTPTPTPQGGRVTVVSPDGKRGSIPANQLQQALSAGYKQVK